MENETSERDQLTEPVTEPVNTNLGTLCHLLGLLGYIGVPFGNIAGPLVLWLLKRAEDPFLDATGKEVLNFQISLTIYAIISGLLVLAVIGFALLPIVLILGIVFTIIAAIKSREGVLYRYPLTIRFLK